MAKNPLLALQEFGQSVWYDNIRRGLISSGELARLIAEDGLRGVTSNPTIFAKAIAGSDDYDEAITRLSSQKLEIAEIYERLAIEDIRLAAELFRPIYEESEGQDGLISLEVSPLLAQLTEETVAEAKRLFRLVDRPNVLIKVPATPAGISAVEQLLREGINVNITLMFSLAHYEAVTEAYLRGLEARARNGEPLARVSSVASFFVSRVDTAVDRALEQLDAAGARHAVPLQGKIAIANSKLVYRRFREIFTGARFQALAEQGARPQRVLWASTSTKNPAYSDVRYVAELIGPDTVNTVPPVTLNAFRDHGRVRGVTIEEELAGAGEAVEELARLGIDLDQITEQLQRDGVQAFASSYHQLLASLSEKLRHKES
ncbi:MAG TPA: transaldolase [Candidatus Fraserbacteria bacterium]|nr:transaldolase [Candidatus Fraserbacteria bacterium]